MLVPNGQEFMCISIIFLVYVVVTYVSLSENPPFGQRKSYNNLKRAKCIRE